MIRLTCIIVAYNDPQSLQACVESIYCGALAPQEVIIVNNGENKIRIVGYSPTVLDYGTNLGFSRAVNLAARLATGDLMVMINPDVVLDNDALQKTSLIASNNPNVIFGGQSRYENGSINCLNGGRILSLFQLSTFLFGMGGYWHHRNQPRDYIAGCLLAIDRQTWDRLNGFDESFFMYFEDMDLCYRAKMKKLQCAVFEDIRYIHTGGKLPREQITKCNFYRNSCIMYMRKHWHWLPCALGTCLILLWWIRRATLIFFMRSLTLAINATK